MSSQNNKLKFFQLTKTFVRKTKLQIFLISCGSLILPALVIPSIPRKIGNLFLTPVSAVAQAQESSVENSASSSKTILKIGALAIRGREHTLSKWQPLAEYLSTNIPGYSFEIVILNFEDVNQKVEDKNIDFMLVNPGMYVNFEAEYGVNRIATLKNLRLGNPYTNFGAVIITKADRQDVNSLDDLKDQTFMAVSKNALGGWQMAWGVMKEAGIKPEKDLKELSFGKSHDAVVQAVLDGTVDAGTVRTDTLERMNAEGKIKLGDLKIINQQQDPSGKFPFVHSTPLYPEWPFAVSKGVPIEISEKVSAALLSMPKDSPAAIAAKSEGWTIPLNYSPVHELFRDLNLGPYKELRVISYSDLLLRLWYIPALALALITLATTIIYFQKRGLTQRVLSEAALNELNKSLEKSNQSLEESVEQQRLEKEKLELGIYSLIEEISDAAEGDLTVRANLDSMELSTIADIFNAIIDNLKEIAMETKQSSARVGKSLKQNEADISLLTAQAIAEAQETRNTLVSIEKMANSIQTVATNASQVEKIADDTYNTAVESSNNMSSTVSSIIDLKNTVSETADKMKLLGESSQRISQAVTLIEEIALKTNVLAVNARVEARRAGEYGQGFTIVAEQVGSLAEQSVQATKEIANIVTAIQLETREVSDAMKSGTIQALESTKLVEATKQSLGLMLEKSQEINQLMGSITQATVSQASTSQDVTNLMQKIAKLSEITSESSKKVAESIGETAQVAQKLESAVAQFKVAEST